MHYKYDVIRLLEAVGIPEEESAKLIEVPKDPSLGDFAFPCFSLAKEMKKAPAAIAEEFASKIHKTHTVDKIQAAGPYINFFISREALGKTVVGKILEQTSLYGSGAKKNETIMIEYPAPNTNKPLHLGHVRNMLLGSSVCSILGFAGYKVIPVDLVNDRGVHICKSMLAYQKWGEGKEPTKKSDHFVGDFYVLYSKKEAEDPKLAEEVSQMLRKWEEKDRDTLELWHKMRKWSLDGMAQTYRELDVFHAKTYYESQIYESGRELILEGLENGIFQKDETGAIVVNLEEFSLGKKVLLRADGTSIYITQDIFLAKLKFDEFKMDRSIHVVGNEQIHHFKVLFKILELLEMPFAKKCYHLSYGYVSLPSGRMKSREGTVVDADDLIAEMKNVALTEVKKRNMDLPGDEASRRARQIGLGALKFFVLKYDALKDFTYNPEESISFEGETGPYIQYAHARICSVFRQAKKEFPDANARLHFIHDAEASLVRMLAKYPDIIEESAEKYNPSLVARYSLQLAQEFSRFYNECPILKADKQTMESRLALCHAVRIVLQSSLSLLGMRAPEEM